MEYEIPAWEGTLKDTFKCTDLGKAFCKHAQFSQFSTFGLQ